MHKVIHIDYKSKISQCFVLPLEADWLEWLHVMEGYSVGACFKLVCEGKFTDGDEEWVVA